MKEKQEALNTIKQVIDQSVKRGLFENTDTVLVVNNALQFIAQELLKEQTTNDAQ